MKSRKALTLADAKIIMAAAEAHAIANNWAVTIAVCDETGLALVLQRLDRAPPMTVDIALGKARTAALARGPTKALEDLILKGRTSMLALPGVTAIEGGVPIYVDGDCIGSVAASGVQGYEDAAIAQAGIDALLRK